MILLMILLMVCGSDANETGVDVDDDDTGHGSYNDNVGVV